MSPGRWAPIAAVVVGGIVFLSVLTGPSGLEPEGNPTETPSIPAQTTTTVPAPGSRRDLWVPPSGTWVGGFAFTSNRPEVLFGPSMVAGLLNISPSTVIVDSLADGRLVGVDSDTQQVVLIGNEESSPTLQITPLPGPGPQSTHPLVSPDGTRLAMIDATGVPYLWAVGHESVVSPADSVSTAVEAIASLSWSPDSTLVVLNAFQGGYYIWDLDTNEVSRSSMPGRAIAISNSQVAAWGSDGLELRDLLGRVLRRWDDLFDPFSTDPSPGPAGPGVPVFIEGAFDPLQRYLAVRGSVGPDADSPEGLTVLSTIGTTRQVLTTDRAQGFSWSGDGSGLYWRDSTGLQVWSADPERASATMLGGSDEDIGRLRVYDPAVSPVPHSALATSTLFELHPEEGVVYVRTMAGRSSIDMAAAFTSIIPAGLPGFFLSAAAGEAEQPVMLIEENWAGVTETLGTLNSLQLPDGARLTRAIALSPGDGEDLTPSALAATRWYLETNAGAILFGPDAGLFTTVAEGTSLSFLGGTAFCVTPDGSAIQTIPIGTGLNTVLTAADLNAERILAVATVRRALFVLVAIADGSAQVWQVPADSPLLSTPLFPPAPTITSDAWVVYEFPGPVIGGAIVTEPDSGPSGELLAVRFDGPAGPVTVVIAAPLALESVCGASAGGACGIALQPGTPLGFSPDGNWLLVGDGDTYAALSTVGRGRAILPGLAPDNVAWVGAGR